jgi:hypothetical protein
MIAMTSVIDDIYDVYGTFEEIELFTEAVETLKLIHILFSYLLIKCKFKHLIIILTIHINLKSN